ncbi:MAG: VTT domain-containing protein, partial [Ardenticatenaceae bacterium]
PCDCPYTKGQGCPLGHGIAPTPVVLSTKKVNQKQMPEKIKQKRAQQPKFGKWALIVVAIILTLGLAYLLSRGSRLSQLLGFLGYIILASSFIPLPTPPYAIALGEVFHPAIVGFLGALGTCIAALIEYPILNWLFSKNTLKKWIEGNRFFQFFAPHFQKYAFAWLVVAAFTPIPLEPFRFTVILTRYNIPKYLLALFIGRFPLYYIMALIGEASMISTSGMIIMLIVLLLIPLIGIAVKGLPFANQ